MKLSYWISGISALLLCTAVHASDAGKTIRSTDIFKQPSYQSEKLGTLDKNSPVSVLDRQGGWYLIKADEQEYQGWIRMLSIRLGTGNKEKGDSGIAALSQFARTGQSGQVVATGVRGLSEENIKEAKPDIQELKKMQGYQVSKPEARSFARQSDLRARNIEYLEASANTDQEQPTKSFNFSD